MRALDFYDDELADMHELVAADTTVPDAAGIVAGRSAKDVTPERLAQMYPLWAAILGNHEQAPAGSPAVVILLAGGDLLAAFRDWGMAEVQYLAMVGANMDVERREITAEQWRQARAALPGDFDGTLIDLSGVSER